MVELQASVQCPACGTELSREQGSEGLCPGCLIELALDDTALEAELLVDPTEAPTLLFSAETFAEGEIQGERYRIRSLLGRGGMGEVWRAYDLKLRQDVALKALRIELIQDKKALETLRQEVRTAREVISPNVCRVFDLQEVDSQELVSMEYIDGTTLQKILEERSPLELDEAREIASQFLAGLEAIHAAGLVHRDIKPENVMVTRTGRVVVMDFGIAKGLGDSKGGVVAGTPAYMSAEQTRGGELDARSDVFSAGVVLAEMVAPPGTRSFADRRQLWEAIHQETPEIAETPWSRVIARCVEAAPEARYGSAVELARALEEVTLRAVGDDEARPYPGLAAFQQEDAEYFYGRELEVEALWKKLRRPHLLAVIGPSGAGKSSFLRAGLLPTLTDSWGALVATPGNRPFANLARELAPELEGDSDQVDRLLQFEELEVAVELLSQWRRGHEHGLVILDQFEELFTQNPPEVQARCAELLGRLPLAADVHVLLSMRDDFLMHCHRFEALQPIFAELSPLDPPLGAALRRALVQPALKCGYRFEDESLVEGMLGEVEGERGALPLLAFAAAQLWEQRDRESGLITNKAYEQIGGVGGALGQHAEATLEQIGEDRENIVRELFRNLVTAQGTRAARDREELLSVFGSGGTASVPAGEGGGHESAADVLDTLIDARLLTSYEVSTAEEGEPPQQRIEVIHESLLSNWPRLVRWRMQDAEGAQLRDDLRQAAQRWEAKGRPEDLLWTGTAYREYQLWRERYPGGLTATEEAFGDAMVRHAERRKRRRRVAIITAFGVLLAVLGVIAYLGWQTELARRRAEAETLRAEASKLIALGQLELDSYPTAALAWATRSLELADTLEGRKLALRALQQGPPATVLRASPRFEAEGKQISALAFSPNGEWLATAGSERAEIRFQDGRTPVDVGHYSRKEAWLRVAFGADDLLVTDQGGDLRWWSVPEGGELRRAEGNRGRLHWPRGDGYFSMTTEKGRETIHWWPFAEGASRLVGFMAEISAADIDARGVWLAFSREQTVHIRPLDDWSRPPRMLGKHAAEVAELAFHPGGERVAARDRSGEIRVWPTTDRAAEPLRVLEAGKLREIRYDPSGRWLAAQGVVEGSPTVRLWDLSAPQGIEPLTLQRTDDVFAHWLAFHPTKPWLVTSNLNSAGFWPLATRYPWTLAGHVGRVSDLVFTPSGDWLVSAAADGVRAWPLAGQNAGVTRVLLQRRLDFPDIDIQSTGEQLAVAAGDGTVLVVPLAGGTVQQLTGYARSATVAGILVAFSPDGRQLAAVPIWAPADEMVIRVWDLAAGDVRTFGPVVGSSAHIGFIDDHRLRWSGRSDAGGGGGETIFGLENGSVEVVADSGSEKSRTVGRSGSFMLTTEGRGAGQGKSDLVWRSLETGESRQIVSHGDAPWAVALDPSVRWMVTGGFDDGLVRVGPVSGGEPHLLYGHQGLIRAVAVSPDGRWIASGGDDSMVRLWPMPDLSQPAFHERPLDELLVTLHSLTNLRIVEAADSPTGWQVETGPFPGWQEVPEW